MATDILQKIDSYFKQFDKDEISSLQLSMSVETAFDNVIKDANPPVEVKKEDDTKTGVAFSSFSKFHPCGVCHIYSFCNCFRNDFVAMLTRNNNIRVRDARDVLFRYGPEFLNSHVDILERGVSRHPYDVIIALMYNENKKRLDSLKLQVQRKAISNMRRDYEDANANVEHYEKKVKEAELKLQKAKENLDEWKASAMDKKRELEEAEKNVLQ